MLNLHIHWNHHIDWGLYHNPIYLRTYWNYVLQILQNLPNIAITLRFPYTEKLLTLNRKSLHTIIFLKHVWYKCTASSNSHCCVRVISLMMASTGRNMSQTTMQTNEAVMQASSAQRRCFINYYPNFKGVRSNDWAYIHPMSSYKTCL
jgi:hypothetical protein